MLMMVHLTYKKSSQMNTPQPFSHQYDQKNQFTRPDNHPQASQIELPNPFYPSLLSQGQIISQKSTIDIAIQQIATSGQINQGTIPPLTQVNALSNLPPLTSSTPTTSTSTSKYPPLPFNQSQTQEITKMNNQPTTPLIAFQKLFQQNQQQQINQTMPPPPVNTLHCLILESKTGLKQIPQGVTHYFVNSKRRFFVYFRLQEQMISTMKVLAQKNIRFYRRQSLLPDREEYQEYVYHCNYRFKKLDLRKNLYHNTPYNEPRVLFDKVQTEKEKEEVVAQIVKQNKLEKEGDKSREKDGGDEKIEVQEQKKEGGIKNEKIKDILNDKQLLAGIFQALNFMH